jgi:hypothetical protein
LRNACIAYSIFLVAALGASNVAKGRDCQDDAKTAVSGIGKVALMRPGSGGSIILLEEDHSSYRANVEEAIFLLRLHAACGLNDIGLEGYTKQDRQFYRLGGANPRVAATMLMDGEISAAEFMYLGFDVHVYPIEDENDRAPYDQGNLDAAQDLLQKLLNSNVTRRLRNHEITADQIQRARTPSQQMALVDDPFLVEFWKKATGTESKFVNEQEEITMYEKLSQLAQSPDKAALAASIQFLGKRHNASLTMSKSIVEITKRIGTDASVAAIIGAAHTPDMVRELATSGRPVVVFTPEIAGLITEAYTGPEMRAKEQRASSRQDSLGETLRSVLEGAPRMKPQPTVTSPSVATEFELLDKLDRLTVLAFGAGGSGGIIPPRRPRNSKGEFPEDAGLIEKLWTGIPGELLTGAFFLIDSNKIELTRSPDGFAALLLPVVFTNEDKRKNSTVWFKLAKSDIALGKGRELTTEQQLVQTASNRPPTEKSNDVKVEEISPETSLAFGLDKTKVRETVLNRS